MEQNGNLTILSCGDNPHVSTGYGTVWNALLKRWTKLKPNWKFYHIGWQSFDRPHQTKEGYWMLPRGNKDYGYDKVYENIMKYKPDIFVSLCDVGYQAGYIDAVRKARIAGWTGKWVAYTPIDSHGWSTEWRSVFAQPDINVAMAQFGAQHMIEHNVKNVYCIPHGVDLEEFKPLPNKKEHKKRYGLQDKFVVGFVGRNQKRKMVDRLLLGFAKFSKGKDDVVLALHSDTVGMNEGWHLPLLIDLFDIQKKVIFTKGDLNPVARQEIQSNEMNDIYNSFDIFGYSTGGEGFGLPGLECQAAGTPLLMTDCSTALDLCKPENKIKPLMDVYGRRVIDRGFNGVYFVYPDDNHMAELFEKYYQMWKSNDKKLEEESESARKFSEQYNWDNLSTMWVKLFEENARK